MTVSYAQFIIEFPEFDQVAQALIEAKLADAERFLDTGAFGEATLYDTAVNYKAAHLLLLSPFGQQTQLISDDGRTTYGDYFDQKILPLIRRRGQISGGGLT